MTKPKNAAAPTRADETRKAARVDGARRHGLASTALFVQTSHLQQCLEEAGVSPEMRSHVEAVIQEAFDAGVAAGAAAGGQSARKAADSALDGLRCYAIKEAERWLEQWQEDHGHQGRKRPTISACINGYRPSRHAPFAMPGVREAIMREAAKSDAARVRAIAQNCSPRTVTAWLKGSPELARRFLD